MLPLDPEIPIKVFATRGSEYFIDGVVKGLTECFRKQKRSVNVSAGTTKVAVFDNYNLEVTVTDNVRGHFAIVISTQVVPHVNDNLIELFALFEALSNAKAAGILLVHPYMPYSRSDLKRKSRSSTMATVMAKFTNLMKVEHVLIFQPHALHVQHYYDPTANIVPMDPLLASYVRRKVLKQHMAKNCVVVFADAGATKRFEDFPTDLGLDQAHIVKQRNGTEVIVKDVIGDVKEKHCFIIDDEISSGRTAVRDAEALKEAGAATVNILAAHGVLSKLGVAQREVVESLENSIIDSFVLTNTTPCMEATAGLKKFVILDAIPLITESIARCLTTGSLTELWNPDAVDKLCPDHLS